MEINDILIRVITALTLFVIGLIIFGFRYMMDHYFNDSEEKSFPKLEIKYYDGLKVYSASLYDICATGDTPEEAIAIGLNNECTPEEGASMTLGLILFGIAILIGLAKALNWFLLLFLDDGRKS